MFFFIIYLIEKNFYDLVDRVFDLNMIKYEGYEMK